MAEQKNNGDAKGVKTLGIRLPDELHAQFALVAQLDGLSLTDAIRRAVEFYVQAKRSEGDFAERAAAALAEIEREANTRRNAIQALFGSAENPSDGSKEAATPGEGEPATPVPPSAGMEAASATAQTDKPSTSRKGRS